eukprot:366206-Chlamydomonas_euryale.AAC.5
MPAADAVKLQAAAPSICNGIKQPAGDACSRHARGSGSYHRGWMEAGGVRVLAPRMSVNRPGTRVACRVTALDRDEDAPLPPWRPARR